jgi:hypothetical protein
MTKPGLMSVYLASTVAAPATETMPYYITLPQAILSS